MLSTMQVLSNEKRLLGKLYHEVRFSLHFLLYLYVYPKGCVATGGPVEKGYRSKVDPSDMNQAHVFSQFILHLYVIPHVGVQIYVKCMQNACIFISELCTSLLTSGHLFKSI